jgi:hypothetical protein
VAFPRFLFFGMMEKENFYVNIQKTVINIIQKRKEKSIKGKENHPSSLKIERKESFFFLLLFFLFS